MVTSQYVSTAERINDNHVSRVLLGPCSVQLRDILRHHVPSSTFPQVIQRQSFKLPRLTKPQMDLILPRAGHYSGNYDDFDISLLCILLRNICNIPPHTKGWGRDQVLSDVSLNVNIERISMARNIVVGHIISSSMSNSDFNDIWSTARTSVVAVDTSLKNNQQYEKAVDVLKNERMDSGMTKQCKTKHRGHMKETRKRIDETNKKSKDEESDINRLKQKLIKVNNDSTKVISLSPLHEREKELPIELLFAQVVIRNDPKYTEDGKNSDSMFEIETSNQLPVRYHNQVWQILFRSDSDSGSNVRRPSWGQLSVINTIKIKTGFGIFNHNGDMMSEKTLIAATDKAKQQFRRNHCTGNGIDVFQICRLLLGKICAKDNILRQNLRESEGRDYVTQVHMLTRPKTGFSLQHLSKKILSAEEERNMRKDQAEVQSFLPNSFLRILSQLLRQRICFIMVGSSKYCNVTIFVTSEKDEIEVTDSDETNEVLTKPLGSKFNLDDTYKLASCCLNLKSCGHQDVLESLLRSLESDICFPLSSYHTYYMDEDYFPHGEVGSAFLRLLINHWIDVMLFLKKSRLFLPFVNDEVVTLGSGKTMCLGYGNRLRCKDILLSNIASYGLKGMDSYSNLIILDSIETAEMPVKKISKHDDFLHLFSKISHHDFAEVETTLLHGRCLSIQRGEGALGHVGRPHAVKHIFCPDLKGKNTPEAEFAEVFKDFSFDFSLMSGYMTLYAFELCSMLEIPDDWKLFQLLTNIKESVFKAGCSKGYDESLQEKMHTFPMYTYHDDKDSSKSESARTACFIGGFDQAKNVLEDHFQSDDNIPTIWKESNPENSILYVTGMSYTEESSQVSVSYNKGVQQLVYEMECLRKELDILKEKCEFLHKKMNSSSNNNQTESESTNSSDRPERVLKDCDESMVGRNQTELERRNLDDYISFRDDINGENCSKTVKCPQEKKFDTAEAFENSHVTQMENRDEVGYISHDLNELLDASEDHDSIVGKREDINNDNSDRIYDNLLASEKFSVSDIDENVPEYTDVVFGVSAQEVAKGKELLSALSTHSQSPDVTLGSLLSSGEFQHVYTAGYASGEEICPLHCEDVEQNGLLEIREEGLSSKDHDYEERWLSENLEKQLFPKQHALREASLEDKTLHQDLVTESLVHCDQETDSFLAERSFSIAENAVAENLIYGDISTESSAFESASRESPEVNDKPEWNNTLPEQLIFEAVCKCFAEKQISSERTALCNKLSTERLSDEIFQEDAAANASSPDGKPFVLAIYKTGVDMTSLRTFTTPFVGNKSILHPSVYTAVHGTSVMEYTPVQRPSVVANTSVLDTTVMESKSLLETLFVDKTTYLSPTVDHILFMHNVTAHKPLVVYMESKHENPIVAKATVPEHSEEVKKSLLRTPFVENTSLLEPSVLDKISIKDKTSLLMKSSDAASKSIMTSFVEITSVPETSFMVKVSPQDSSILNDKFLKDSTPDTEMLISESTSLLKTPFVDHTPILEPSVIDITLFVDNRVVLYLLVTRESSPGKPLLENVKLLEVDNSPVQCSLTDRSVLNHSEQKTSFPCSKQGNKSLVEENNSLGCEMEENGALQCSEEDIKQGLYSPEGNQSLHHSDEGRTSVRCSEEDVLSLLCSANDSKSSQSTGENEESHQYLLKDNRTVVNSFPVLPHNDSESALKVKAVLRDHLKKFCLKFEIDKSTECKSSNQALLNAHLRDKSTEDLVIHFFKSLEFENVMKRSTRLQKLCNDVINHYFRYLKCYYEAHVFPAQLPRTGLDGYFQRVLEGEEMTYRDKMQYEWLRIQSFWSFPINIGMSMIYLARNGFYYTGRSTECRCYFCGHTYNDWEATDNNSERIIEIHRRISPNCVFLTGSSHNNVPIHQESPVSFAFGAPPPREPRTAIEGSVPSPPGATSEATGLSDHAQASASAALLPNFPATSLPAPSMSTSGQANSVSSAPVSAQSSTATAATTNQPLAPSVTASSSSGLPSTSQPTASQSGATFLVEPSPTISMPPASHSSGQGSSDPLQHAKPLPQRDKSPSPGQQSHDNQQGSGAPSFIPTIPSQASAVIPDPVPRASDEASGHMKPRESTLPGAQSSADRRNTDRRQADDTQVVSRSSNVTSSTPRVVYRITLHLSSFHYTEELSDPNNPEFLRISGQITPVLEHLFQSIAGDQRINIIRFIPNPPVLIVFDLESYYFSDEAVLRSVFDQAIQKGSIAVYRISPEGFEFRLTEESNLQVESATGQQQQALSAPATSAPATSVPATSVPVTSVPATSVSATSAPATSASATSAPATSAAATSALATNQAASSASGQQNAPETGRQRMGTSTTAPPRPQRFDPLGINFDRPRYPAYAVLTVRNGSYSDWPTSLTQEPLDMALAGFFYAGYGDYVRCFFCGGGLRNWDDGDDPWVEHAKWFPRCAFVRQNKGEKFVNDIQRRHHEQGAGIEFEEEIEEQIPDEELPAYRSLIEMNYSPETVQRAIETFRQRIRPGRQAPLPMSATNLADIIFEFENGNSNSDIAEVRQSEGEEVERTTEGVRSASHATEGMRTEPPAIEELRTEPPATEGVKTSSPATEDVRIESPSETTPSDVAESGRISEEERRAEQTKLLDEASALESTSSQEGEGDLETLKEENISLKEKLKCKVCLEKDVAVAFLPCGHLVCCTDCAPAIRICIICNEMVKGTVKTFFP